MSTFVKIKSIRDSLSASEEKLANFILNSSNAIRELSSQELANVVGVSQSSVVKFTQKLGYKGYPAFKLAIIDALNDEVSDQHIQETLTHNADISQIAEVLLSQKNHVLTETKRLNEQATLSKAIDALASAKRIMICGLGDAAMIGEYFAQKLNQLGFPALAESDSHGQLRYISTFSKEDLLFVICATGATRQIAEISKLGKQQKCPVISLTKYGSTPISDNAEIKLFSVAEQQSIRLSSILAISSQEYVIELLFLALSQLSRQTIKRLEHSQALIEQHNK